MTDRELLNILVIFLLICGGAIVIYITLRFTRPMVDDRNGTYEVWDELEMALLSTYSMVHVTGNYKERRNEVSLALAAVKRNIAEYPDYEEMTRKRSVFIENDMLDEILAPLEDCPLTKENYLKGMQVFNNLNNDARLSIEEYTECFIDSFETIFKH